MKLSIIILFCDKDYIYLKDIVSQIKEKANVDYEILLLDNRINNKKEKLGLDNFDNIKLFDFDDNTLNWGRLRLVSKATGDYIWFCDVDDEILKFPDMSNYTKDIYHYNFFNEELDRVIDMKDMDLFYWCALWNKIIKTDLLKKVITILDINAHISLFDDNIIYWVVEKLAKEHEYIDDVLYKYKTSRAQICSKSQKKYDENRCKIMLAGIDNKDYLKELEKLKSYENYKEVEGFIFFNLVDFCLRFTEIEVGCKYMNKLLKLFPKHKIDLFNILSNSYYSIEDMTKVFS